MVWWFCVKSAAAYKGREGLGLATAATGYTRKELIVLCGQIGVEGGFTLVGQSGKGIVLGRVAPEVAHFLELVEPLDDGLGAGL